MTNDLHTLTMDEIRALDAAALNVFVARARGWRVERVDGGWRAYRPDGTQWADGYPHTWEAGDNPSDQWILVEFGNVGVISYGPAKSERDAWAVIPNAAWELWRNTWSELRSGGGWIEAPGLYVQKNLMNWDGGLAEIGHSFSLVHEESGNELARIWTLAWCAWRKERGA